MKHMMKTIADDFLAFAVALVLIFAFFGIAKYLQIPDSFVALSLACWLLAREVVKSMRKNS